MKKRVGVSDTAVGLHNINVQLEIQVAWWEMKYSHFQKVSNPSELAKGEYLKHAYDILENLTWKAEAGLPKSPTGFWVGRGGGLSSKLSDTEKTRDSPNAA